VYKKTSAYLSEVYYFFVREMVLSFENEESCDDDENERKSDEN